MAPNKGSTLCSCEINTLLCFWVPFPALYPLSFPSFWTLSWRSCPTSLQSRRGWHRSRDGRAGLERAGLTFVKPGWAGAGWAGLATAHKNRAAGFFPSINWLFVLQVLFFTANDWRKLNLNKKGIMKYFLGGPSQGIRGSQGFILPHLEMVS